MQQLIYSPKVVVPFLMDIEKNKSAIAVSTKKFFDSYGLTVYE